MLFVAAMEDLSRMVIKAVEVELFESLASISPIQRISVYADDVLLFLKPEEKELWAVKNILSIFGEASGLHVNFGKTTATMIRGTPTEEERTARILGCELAAFPIRYLGLQLALRPLTRAEWQPLLDQVVKSVPAWQRGLVSREGRLVLINSVVTARAVHQMVVAEAPMWLLEEINKWMRAFFWAGGGEVRGGQCLVAWSSICKPREFGGLGVKDLKLQGLALRVRWHWLRRTDQERPWKGLPGLKDPEAEGVFQSLARFVMGDGHLTFFWRDRWIDGYTAEELAPDVFAMVPTRRKNTRRVAEALRDDGWIDDIHGEMTVELWMQCMRLWEAVEMVEKDVTSPDRIEWKGAESDNYTARGTYRMLCLGSVRWSMSEPVW
jgi:hypothetical protein